MSGWVKPPITEATIRQRVRLAEAQDGFCPACGYALPDDLSETEVDHIVPRARGGPNAPWNKRLVHFACNRSKKDKLTEGAIALAAAYGLTLIEPGTTSPRPVEEPEEVPWWSWRNARTLYPRKCDWCGAQVVVSTDDLEVLVACSDCDAAGAEEEAARLSALTGDEARRLITAAAGELRRGG